MLLIIAISPPIAPIICSCRTSDSDNFSHSDGKHRRSHSQKLTWATKRAMQNEGLIYFESLTPLRSLVLSSYGKLWMSMAPLTSLTSHNLTFCMKTQMMLCGTIEMSQTIMSVCGLCRAHISPVEYNNPIDRERVAQTHKESTEGCGTLRFAETESKRVTVQTGSPTA